MSDIGRAEPLHLRLFLEGVEVPVIGAVVSASEGSPATAQIEMVPANAGLHLAARTKVLLFFLDGAGDLPADVTRASIPDDEHRELTEAGYYLLFSGELFSLSYSKSGPGSRSLVLQCLDDSNNWDTSYLFTLRYSAGAQDGAVAGNPANFLALNSNTNPLDDILSDPADIIRQIARRQQGLNPSVAGSKGMLGGLLGILELIGGIPGRYIGMTAWHTIQEARVRLMDQIGADSGTTAAALFDATAFEDWLTKGLGDLGTVVSYRSIIGLINEYIYYSVAPNPVGVYRAGERNPPDWPNGLFETAASGDADTADGGAGSGDDANLDPTFASLKNQVLQKLIEMGWNGTTKPLARQTSGYRSADEQASLQKGTRREGKAPYSPHMYGFAADISLAGAGIGFVYKNVGSESGSLHKRLIFWTEKLKLSTLEALATCGKFTAAEIATMQQMVAFYKDLGEAVKAVGGGLEWGGSWASSDAWTKLIAGSGYGDCVHIQMAGWRTLAKAKGLTVEQPSAVDLAGFYSSMPDRERLYTQYFRPDIWFVPPPACNIIFPEEVATLSFGRDLLRETTRLQLSTFNAVMGDDVILNQVYFAPQIDQVQSLTSGGLGTAKTALIYPHERYSGIIPKMEKISDLSFYSRLSEDQKITGEAKDLKEDEVASKAENQLETWAARTAVFTYLSRRYDARTLDLQMKFTPRLAVGFPALVIDRTNPEQLDDSEPQTTNPFSPNHFLGMVRSLSHSISQSGATTSIHLSHVRLHRADMDDLFATSVYKNKGVLSVQVVPSPAEPQTFTNKDTTMSTRVFRWLQTVNKGLSLGELDLAKPDIYGPNAMPLVGAITIVKVMPENSTVTWSTNDTELIGPQLQDEFPFSSITFTESTGDPTYLPLEEAIRPPWMSDEYANANIGALYQSLLGCKSLIDLYDNVEPRTVDGVKLSSAGIEDMTEKVVQQYTAASDGGYLGASFIREVTRRDYASLGEVFGYTDAKGVFHEGFYTQALAEGRSGLSGTLFEWMAGEGTTTIGTQVNPAETDKVDPQLDPRPGRTLLAQAYKSELLQSRGRRG